MHSRILFEVDGKLRSFYWFECQDEDIYWGYSGKHSYRLASRFDGLSATISPRSRPFERITHTKMSYHQSGEFHERIVKEDGSPEYESVMRWRAIQSLDKPFRIMALFTKPLMNYDCYKRSPTKGGSGAVIIKFVGQLKSVRKYVEFFITPEGTFPVPDTLVSIKKETMQNFLCPLSSKYTLLIRMTDIHYDELLDTVYPDSEIIIFTEDKKNELNR